MRGLIRANPNAEPLDLVFLVASGRRDDLALPPNGWDDPWILGLLHEQAVSELNRDARGAWYTPEIVVRGLTKLAFDEANFLPQVVLDPTCGGGAFLLAAMDEMVSRGVAPAIAITRVRGMDIDADAVQVCKLALKFWARVNRFEFDEALEKNIVLGNALSDIPESWTCKRIVLGNPPFGSPLHSGVLDQVAIDFRVANINLMGSLADMAAMHLLRSVQQSADGSVVSMIQPLSVVSARDLRYLRKHLDEDSPLTAIWVAKKALFEASVKACATVLRVGGSKGPVSLARGKDVIVEQKADYSPWNILAADALGAPQGINADELETLGTITNATAGFRDEYYGLTGACKEWDLDSEPVNKLVTVGSIDPLWCFWGKSEIQFANQRWIKPWVDPELIPEKTVAWVKRQFKPKILLATQAKTLEPVIDFDGNFVSVTPLIIVEPEPGYLEKVAAVFLAPPVVLWAWRKWFGAAMSLGSIKLSAKQVLQLPLPSNLDLWEQAANLITKDDLLSESAARALSIRVAEIMNSAYGADQEIFDWWSSRLN